MAVEDDPIGRGWAIAALRDPLPRESVDEGRLPDARSPDEPYDETIVDRSLLRLELPPLAKKAHSARCVDDEQAVAGEPGSDALPGRRVDRLRRARGSRALAHASPPFGSREARSRSGSEPPKHAAIASREPSSSRMPSRVSSRAESPSPRLARKRSILARASSTISPLSR